MTPLADRFMSALVAAGRGRRRIPLHIAWEAFAAVHGDQVPGDRRREMRSLFDQVAAAGSITLPAADGKAWDRSALPHLPAFLLTAEVQIEAAARSFRTHPWAPELSFLADAIALPGQANWLAFDAWLKKSGRDAIPAPIPERSWEIFADEKALNPFLRRQPFASGRLDALALSRSFDAPEPLTATLCAAAHGRPVLVVENAAAFHSLGAWNAQRHRWSAILYGRGNSFGTAWQALPQLCAEHGTQVVEYAGDIDAAGLAIPYARVGDLARHGLTLEACAWLYGMMLRHGGMGQETGRGAWILKDASRWLPPDIRGRVSELASRGLRVPQEAFGTTQLRNQDPPPLVS